MVLEEVEDAAGRMTGAAWLAGIDSAAPIRWQHTSCAHPRVPLSPDVSRQWPQLGEVVGGRDLVATVEGNFPELRLAVGRRQRLGDIVVVEWSCDYGDGRIYRNVTIAELDQDGYAVRVTDYWGEPISTPEWRRTLTDRLPMPGDETWPDLARLAQH